jgi:uncharacterized protein YndB with AHSA1/START domain
MSIQFSNALTIEHAPAEVFAYLADFENLSAWNYAIASTRKIGNGPVGIGTRYVQVRTVPTHSEESFEVVEFEPVSRLAIRGRFAVFPGELSYLVEPDGGGTRLTNAVSLNGPRLAARRIQSAVAANLNVLKQLLEGHA